MKETLAPFLETQDLTETETKIFKALRSYFDDHEDTKQITNEEIVDRIKKVYRHDIPRVQE